MTGLGHVLGGVSSLWVGEAGPVQCSGNSWSQLWGQEGIFPWDRLALIPRGFGLPLQPGASPLARCVVPSGQAAACSHTEASLCPALGGGCLHFTLGGLGRVPGVFLPSCAALSMARAPLSQSGCSCCVIPQCPAFGWGETFFAPRVRDSTGPHLRSDNTFFCIKGAGSA